VALCREGALVRTGQRARHTAGAFAAAETAATRTPPVSQRSSSSLGAHFRSSFVGTLNGPSRVLPQLFCEIVRHIAHLRSEAEFSPTQVAVWQLFPALPLLAVSCAVLRCPLTESVSG
jgi:hypothetical protein